VPGNANSETPATGVPGRKFMPFDRRRLGSACVAGLAAMALAGLAPTAARAADPIKIGFSMSLTGGLSGGGKSVILAFEIWKEDINAKGGLLGRPVELVYYDDQTNPAQVPGIYSKLLDVDKVDLVVSAYATNQIAPAMPIVMQKNMVFMALFGTGVNDNFKYDKYFQILPNGKETRLAPSLGFLEMAMTMEPKPQTIALVGADAEYAQTVIAGARETVQRLGLKVVYDRSYPPNTVDYTPIVRAIQAANPDVVFVASYPPDSIGMVRAANEVGLKPKMFGGGMIGLAFTPIKLQLGPLLNGIVAYDVYEPEPTMKFPGIEEFLKRYQERAPAAGVDPLGYYLPPYAYAEMQILAQAVNAVGSLDHAKIAAYIHATKFATIVGDVKFADNGEWEKSRVLFVQYQNILANDINQFRQGGKVVILYPSEYKSGKFMYPYSDITR
jgi:branched-chain amino acid transport system substrate-binding protein